MIDLASLLLNAYSIWSYAARSSQSAVEIFAPTLLTVKEPGRTQPGGNKERSLDEWTRGILHLCLYADRIYVPDPLEILAHSICDDEWAGNSIMVHEPFTSDSELCFKAARALTVLDPLIRAGIVVLYPPLACYYKFAAEELFGERRGFTPDEMQNSWPDRYVAEGLHYARNFGASYTALNVEEFGALKNASQSLALSLGLTERKILSSLPTMKLPFFEALDANVMVQARTNESSFADFRLFMREMSFKLAGGLDDPKFTQSINDLDNDEVAPALQKLYDDITGVSSLKQRMSEAPMDFIAGTLATMVLKGDVLEALLAGSVGALTKGLVKMVAMREKARPAASMVYSFHTGRMPSLSLDISLGAIQNSVRIHGQRSKMS